MQVSGLIWFFLCFFGVLMVGALIVTLLRLLIFILPVLSVIGLAVLLAIAIGTEPVLVLAAGFYFLAIILLMFRGNAWLQPPRTQEYSSAESRAEAAGRLKTPTVFWWLKHDQKAQEGTL
jgi:hypothetical protein